MSENRNRSSLDFSIYDTMETDDLEQILRSDADATEGAEPDIELLLYVMEVLADRRRNNKQVTGKTALEAFESFKESYLPEGIYINSVQESKKTVIRPSRWLRGAAAAAAFLAFVFLGSVTANAFGFNIWKAVAVWAKETFRLESDIRAESELPDPNVEFQYASLEEAIYSLELATGIVPTWIPEGYELNDVNVMENPMRRKYSALYKKEESTLKIVVQSYQAACPEQIEQSDGISETYVSSGIIYYFFEDYNQTRVAWIDGSYECYISGELTIQQLKLMVDSIEKG